METLVKMREDLSIKIKRLTMSDVDFAEWAVKQEAIRRLEIVREHEETAKKVKAIRDKEIAESKKLLEAERERRAAQGIIMRAIPERPGKEPTVSIEKIAAMDRKQIEEWLQLKLAKIRSKGHDDHKTIISHMKDVIEKAALTEVAIKAKALKRGVDKAREAGVAEEIIVKEYNTKIAELYAPQIEKRKEALRQEIKALKDAKVKEEDIVKYYNIRIAAINKEVPTLALLEPVIPPSMKEFIAAMKKDIPGISYDTTLLEEHTSREEAIQIHYDKLLTMAQAMEDSKFAIKQVGNARIRAMNAENDAYDRARMLLKKQATLSMAQEINSGLSALYESGLAKNKTIFYAMKALAISEAIISANLAANKVTGQLGVMGIPLSAVIYASAMMRVAAIAAQQPGYAEGGVVTPYGSQGKSVTVAENGPELIVPLSRGRAVPVEMKGGGQQPIVNLSIQAIDTQSGIDFLMKNKSTIGNAILGASADNHPVRRN